MRPPPAAGKPGRMAGLPCRIVLKGDVSERFAPVLHGLSLHRQSGCTELYGTLADQPQLQGLLNRLFDLGMQLVSVTTGTESARQVPPPGPHGDT